MRSGVFELCELPMPHRPDIEEAICAQDAAWFEANEGATERVRAFAQGEAPVGPPPWGHRWVATVVRQLEPGIRTRQFVHVAKADLVGGAA
jgi:hypothetical protein